MKNSAGTDPVILASDKITTTVLPECSASVSTANQLVNKTYADTKVGKSGDEDIGGLKNFTSNVGIGIQSPQRLLHLNNSSGDVYLQMTCRDSGATTSDGFHIRQEAEGHIHISQNENAEMLFKTNNTERIRVTLDGKVGIGTTTPTTELHVIGTLLIDDSNAAGAVLHGQDANHSIHFRTGNDGTVDVLDFYEFGSIRFFTGGNIQNQTERMRIKSDGKVGIGTTDPQSKLDVNGHVYAGYDTNSASVFGRAAIGYNHLSAGGGQTYDDWASFSHLDMNNSSGYALMHSSYGETYINAASGKLIYFRIGNSTAKTLNSSGTFGSSDDRLKTNEQNITNAIETVMKLSPQTYQKYLTMDCSGDFGIQSGFVAQDIWYNAPELRHLVYAGHDASGIKQHL